MKVILFIILPYSSHYNACFGLAQEYRNLGYRVVFTGYPRLRSHVEKQGYEFCDLEYTTEYNIRTFKGLIGFFLRSLLDSKDVRKRYQEWYKSVVEIRKVNEHYKPEQIFIDAHLSHYYLYLFDYRESVTILSEKLSPRKSQCLPPLDSFYIPKKTFLSCLICEFLWFSYFTKIEFKNLKNKVAFLNKDEIYFQKRLCEKYHLRWADIFEKKNSLFTGLKNVPTIILGTEELEFPQRNRLPNEAYLNLPIRRNEEKYFSEEYKLIRTKIESLKKQATYQIIYCAFGTLGSHNYKRVLKFITKLFKAIQEQEYLAIVISTGNLYINFKTESDSIFLLNQVPQLDMLSLSDMMITHGGHNSIKECLQAGVPMLVYPLNKKVDQPGNAVRVQINGYGLYGKIEKDSPGVILNKINCVLRMKENIKQVNIDSTYSFGYR